MAFPRDVGVQSKAVLVISVGLLEAARLAVGDHENLTVGGLSAAEDVHGTLEPRHGIGVKWPHLQIGQIKTKMLRLDYL